MSVPARCRFAIVLLMPLCDPPCLLVVSGQWSVVRFYNTNIILTLGGLSRRFRGFGSADVGLQEPLDGAGLGVMAICGAIEGIQLHPAANLRVRTRFEQPSHHIQRA